MGICFIFYTRDMQDYAMLVNSQQLKQIVLIDLYQQLINLFIPLYEAICFSSNMKCHIYKLLKKMIFIIEILNAIYIEKSNHNLDILDYSSSTEVQLFTENVRKTLYIDYFPKGINVISCNATEDTEQLLNLREYIYYIMEFLTYNWDLLSTLSNMNFDNIVSITILLNECFQKTKSLYQKPEGSNQISLQNIQQIKTTHNDIMQYIMNKNLNINQKLTRILYYILLFIYNYRNQKFNEDQFLQQQSFIMKSLQDSSSVEQNHINLYEYFQLITAQIKTLPMIISVFITHIHCIDLMKISIIQLHNVQLNQNNEFAFTINDQFESRLDIHFIAHLLSQLYKQCHPIPNDLEQLISQYHHCSLSEEHNITFMAFRIQQQQLLKTYLQHQKSHKLTLSNTQQINEND